MSCSSGLQVSYAAALVHGPVEVGGPRTCAAPAEADATHAGSIVMMQYDIACIVACWIRYVVVQHQTIRTRHQRHNRKQPNKLGRSRALFRLPVSALRGHVFICCGETSSPETKPPGSDSMPSSPKPCCQAGTMTATYITNATEREVRGVRQGIITVAASCRSCLRSEGAPYTTRPPSTVIVRTAGKRRI